MPMLGRPPTPAGNLRSFRFVPAPLSPIQCCVRPTGMSRQFKRMTQAALRSPQHWTGGWGSGATQKIRSEFSDAWRGARAERRRGRPIKFLFGRVVEHTWAKPFFGSKSVRLQHFWIWIGGIDSPRCPRFADMGPRAVRGQIPGFGVGGVGGPCML